MTTITLIALLTLAAATTPPTVVQVERGLGNYFIVTPATAIPDFAPGPTPPPPAVIQLERRADHVAVTWHYEGEADAFQVTKRINGVSKPIVVGMHRCSISQVPGSIRRFTWEDHRVSDGVQYYYFVQVFLNGELSAESNVLTIGP